MSSQWAGWTREEAEIVMCFCEGVVCLAEARLAETEDKARAEVEDALFWLSEANALLEEYQSE